MVYRCNVVVLVDVRAKPYWIYTCGNRWRISGKELINFSANRISEHYPTGHTASNCPLRKACDRSMYYELKPLEFEAPLVRYEVLKGNADLHGESIRSGGTGAQRTSSQVRTKLTQNASDVFAVVGSRGLADKHAD